MRDLFPGWTPPDEDTLSRYWEEATFAVDTSVLLDLYRFSEEARSGLLEALRSFGNRLWIPHQVAFEFHRNRFGVLLDQREAEGQLLDELGQLRRELDEQLSKRLRSAGRRDLAPLREALDGGFNQLQEKLKEAEKAHTKGLGGSIREDPIYDEVIELCKEGVGAAFEVDRHAAVLADAEERLKNETPPGYTDANKDGEARLGDVILWHQLCDKAAETRKPMVLVSDDQKKDWIWKVRGATLGPRPELVAEMQQKAEVGFHIYTPARLLEVWEDRGDGREVKREVLDEIQDLAVEPQSPDDFALWIRQKSIRKLNTAVDGVEPVEVEAPPRSWQARQESSKPEHRYAGGSVELSITREGDPGHVVPGIRVTVTDPSGATTKMMVLRPKDGQVPYRHQLVVRYPDDFPGAGELRPGRYWILWHETNIPLADYVEALELAHDTFLVRARARQGNVSYFIDGD